MMKLRIATGLGLVLFMATMIGGPVRVSQAGEDGVTLADLAGNFASKGSGFLTVCLDASFALVDCASAPPHVVPLNDTQISHQTRDAAGNSCVVPTTTSAPVFGTTFPASVLTGTIVDTPISFDPTTGSGTANLSVYHGGSCSGAAFNSTGATLIATGTFTFVVSDSGNRIEQIVTGYSAVTSAFSVVGSVKGFVFTHTLIRQGHQSD